MYKFNGKKHLDGLKDTFTKSIKEIDNIEYLKDENGNVIKKQLNEHQISEREFLRKKL
jgi:hypothetical protein